MGKVYLYPVLLSIFGGHMFTIVPIIYDYLLLGADKFSETYFLEETFIHHQAQVHVKFLVDKIYFPASKNLTKIAHDFFRPLAKQKI